MARQIGFLFSILVNFREQSWLSRQHVLHHKSLFSSPWVIVKWFFLTYASITPNFELMCFFPANSNVHCLKFDPEEVFEVPRVMSFGQIYFSPIQEELAGHS